MLFFVQRLRMKMSRFINTTRVQCLSSVHGPKLILQPLKERSLLSIKGKEVPAFLQGLITNDINHLEKDNSSLFTMFLNSKGRILFDAIIYRLNSETYLTECDTNLVELLQKHLKMYRVRRQIDISNLSTHHVQVLFSKDQFENISKNRGNFKSDLQEINLFENKGLDDLLIFRDPRVSNLGHRIILENSSNITDQINVLFPSVESETDSINYRALRYKLGIGEGENDLLSGSSFPLECNCDYLHGISFHKGCYVGQELTARTFHTGVVRKRLMPLYFDERVKMPTEIMITHEKQNLGKLRGVEGNVGLALLRIDQVLSLKSFEINGTIATVMKPFWWPEEAPKETSFKK